MGRPDAAYAIAIELCRYIPLFLNRDDLQGYIQKQGHLPDKHFVTNRSLLSCAKYQRKKIKEGTLDAEKRELFESLLATRSTEHTGGEEEEIIILTYGFTNYTTLALKDR